MKKTFQKATKLQSYLRLALVGPSGSGKTYSSLRVAQGLGTKIALIDSERGSASKYAGDFAFDTLQLDASFSPDEYMEAIQAAVDGQYEVLIIDSLSHAWNDKGGILELHDAVVANDSRGNDFNAWRQVTPKHNELIDTILRAPLHIIVTMRTKTAYVVEPDDRGKMVPKKIGTKPIQREGLEYEFDVVGDLDQSNTLTFTKTRCKALNQAVIHEPNAENLGKILKQWVTDGAAATINNEQVKALAMLAKVQNLSVGRFIDLVNETLGTQYGSPRELTVDDYPKIVAALQPQPEPSTPEPIEPATEEAAVS